MTERSYTPNIPDRIKEKLNILYNEIDQIESSAMKLIQTSMNESGAIRVENQTMSDFLSDYERSQCVGWASPTITIKMPLLVQFSKLNQKFKK